MKNVLKKIKLIKADSYLFLLKKINSNIKIKRDILFFNFSSELIYKNIYYVKKNDYLYIYNSNIKTKVFLPEGLILFYSTDKDGIYIFKNKNYYNVLIKKNNILINEFILKNINEQIINQLKFEFSLEVFSKNYSESLEKGYEKFDFNDLMYLWDFSFDLKKVKVIFNDFAKPFLISSVIGTLFVFGYKYYLINKKNTIYEQYEQLKKASIVLKKELDKINQNNVKWKMISNELNSPQSFEVLNDVVTAIKGKGKLTYFKNNNNEILFLVDANDSLQILQTFSRNKLFKNITLQSEVTIKRNIKRYRFRGILNEVK